MRFACKKAISQKNKNMRKRFGQQLEAGFKPNVSGIDAI